MAVRVNFSKLARHPHLPEIDRVKYLGMATDYYNQSFIGLLLARLERKHKLNQSPVSGVK